METLDYGDRSPLRYPAISLPIASVSLFLVLVFRALCIYFDDPPFPLPHWLKDLFPFVLVASIVSFAAALQSLLCMRLPHLRSFWLRVLLPIGALCAPLLAWFSPIPSEYAYCGTPGDVIAAQIRGISQDCRIYALDHSGRFPPHPAALILAGYDAPKDYIDWDLAPAGFPHSLPPIASWQDLAAEAEAHSIFIYTGADLTDAALAAENHALDSSVIVAYSLKRRVLRARRAVAFVDAHAELIPESDLPKFFDASNAARAKLRLPAFTLDGPPPHQ
ncbi:MAG TPA: hypothetical protein VHM90_18850 [Phycisphaerae bacterium]|nr:hypothetical protein [Phycisphaerae bacterium]